MMIKKLLAIFWLLIAIPAVIIGCGPASEEEVSFDTVAKGYNSRAIEQQYQVITDQEDWDQVISKVEEQDFDRIDFSQHTVIAVFQGEQNTSGFDIEIERVTRSNGSLKVYINQTVPDSSDIVTQALTSPYHIIKVPELDLEVEFIDL